MNLEKVLEEMKKDVQYTCDKLHEQNQKVNEIYHDIETRNFNAYEGYVLAKELQEALQVRRAWKEKNREAYSEYRSLGGDNKLNQLKKKREKQLKKTYKKTGWYTNFSDEAMKILSGSAI